LDTLITAKTIGLAALVAVREPIAHVVEKRTRSPLPRPPGRRHSHTSTTSSHVAHELAAPVLHVWLALHGAPTPHTAPQK